MEELLRVVVGLVGLTVIPLTGFAVVTLARRRPWLAAALLGVATAAGAGASWHAAGLGYEFRPEVRRVVYASDAARGWFGVGLATLALACPAWPLLVVARARNGDEVGPRGVQWVVVLFGYWLACVVFTAALYSWLTGGVK